MALTTHPKALQTSIMEQLSPREMNVLRLVAQGHANREVARELNLAEVTVKKHVQSIISKLGVSDRTHAVIIAVINSCWAGVTEVEQAVVFEVDGIIEVHTVITTNRREVCYKIYELERELMARFPDMLFDFNLALNLHEVQSLGTAKACIAYDKGKQRNHA